RRRRWRERAWTRAWRRPYHGASRRGCRPLPLRGAGGAVGFARWAPSTRAAREIGQAGRSVRGGTDEVVEALHEHEGLHDHAQKRGAFELLPARGLLAGRSREGAGLDPAGDERFAIFGDGGRRVEQRDARVDDEERIALEMRPER